jgi:hypothetical protein
MKPDEGSTLLAFALAELGSGAGRFKDAEGPTHVVGANAAHPVAGGQRDVVGPEPSLGYRIDELEPGSPPTQAALEPSTVAQATSAPVSAAPSPNALPKSDDVEPGTGARFSGKLRRF